MRILVLANAKAGSIDDEHLARAVDVLAAGADVEVAHSGSPEDLAAALAGLDGRHLVVAGGDGSVHAAVQWLWDNGRLDDTTLGLLPLGTGNDLATGLNLPDDPTEAAAVCLEGVVRPLDLLVTDHGTVVVNASHAGLGAAAAERSAGLKDKLGALAYPLGALIAGVREAAWDLRVTVDDVVVHDGHTLMVGVANAPSIGGGTRLVPPALPDDGLLDVMVVSAIAPAARLAFAVALRDEAHLDRDDVLHLRGSRVTIEGDPVVHDLDGELTAELESCTYRVVPGAWRMTVPGRPA